MLLQLIYFYFVIILLTFLYRCRVERNKNNNPIEKWKKNTLGWELSN